MANGQSINQAQQLGTILTDLLNLGGQEISKAGKAVGGAINQASPIALISQLLGTLSSLPAQQELQKSVEGAATEQKIKDFGLDQTDPRQKAVLDAVVGFEKKNATEALESGESAASVLNIGRQRAVDFSQENQALTGQQKLDNFSQRVHNSAAITSGITLTPLQQQAQNLVQPATSMLGKLFEAAGFGTQTKAKQLNNLLKAQGIIGEEPLQKGEKEKIGLEAVADLKKALATAGIEGLKPEQSGKFSLLLEGEEATRTIDNILFGGSGDFSQDIRNLKFTPDFFKSDRSRQLQLALETAVDDRTRIETGAALQPEELEREAKKLMPRLNESTGTYRKRLGRSFKFFNRALNIADPSGIHRQRAVGSDSFQSGINAEIKRRGL